MLNPDSFKAVVSRRKSMSRRVRSSKSGSGRHSMSVYGYISLFGPEVKDQACNRAFLDPRLAATARLIGAAKLLGCSQATKVQKAKTS